MLNLRSGRGAVLTVATVTVAALVAAGTATGAFGAVGRMLGGSPATTVQIPANQPAAAVKTTKTPVPDPPWASKLPPNVTYPILVDPKSCAYEGTPIDCKDKSGAGYFNPLDNCYWAATVPQPKPGAAVWLGLTSGDGSIYDTRCVVGLDATLKPLLATVRVQFASKLPPGTPTGQLVPDANGAILAAGVGVVVTGILAPTMGVQPQTAATKQAAIDADNNNSIAGLVGLPTWYWSTANLLTIGPITLSLTLPLNLLTLQASLLGQRLEWETGDNGKVVTCEKVGKAFTAGQAGTVPACGYTYTKPGTYAVSARSVWFIAASVVAITGTVLVVRSTLPRYIKIDELQVVTE